MKTRCKVCPQIATETTVYVVAHNGACVDHSTCERHTAPLRADMVEAGWTVHEPVGAGR